MPVYDNTCLCTYRFSIPILSPGGVIQYFYTATLSALHAGTWFPQGPSSIRSHNPMLPPHAHRVACTLISTIHGGTEDYTRVYLSHRRESSQAIHTHSHTIRTLFAQSSHRSHSYSHTIRTVSHYLHTIARSHTIRTLFARSHTIRTVAHYSHTFRTVAHYSRGSHTIRAIFTQNSQTIRTSSHPGHTIRAVPRRALSHSFTHTVFAQFTPVRICECAIGTL
jgi:hypothetical protein